MYNVNQKLELREQLKRKVSGKVATDTEIVITLLILHRTQRITKSDIPELLIYAMGRDRAKLAIKNIPKSVNDELIADIIKSI